MNRYRIWPVGQEIACEAYVTASNILFRKPVNEGGYGSAFDWTVLSYDKHDQPCCALLGEPYEYPLGTPIFEDSTLIAIAGESIIIDKPEWPEDE